MYILCRLILVNLVKGFTLLKLLGKKFILVALASLHNNIYKNRVRLATLNISTTNSENDADEYFLCVGYIMSLALIFCNFAPRVFIVII